MKNISCRLINGECLEEMSKITEDIDAVICDPPYQITACKWDLVIPFNNYILSKKGKPIYKDEFILHFIKKGRNYKDIEEYFDKNSKEGMWQKLNKLIKPNGAIVLFGSEPFSSALRMSNIKNYKYDWIWEKEQGSNFMLVKYQPYKVHEIISVFSKKTHFYKPQKTIGKPYISGKGKSGDVTGNVVKIQTKNNGTRFPRSVQRFNTEKRISQHPTQKPVALIEYLIKTYTNEGETVLDFTMGSGTTAIASLNLKRNFIGIELDDKYFKIGKKRVKEHIKTLDYSPDII